MIREEASQLSSSQHSQVRVPMSQFTDLRGGTESGTEQIYALTTQIETCVWDNIKLTHINAKLLDYAKRQAIDMQKLRNLKPVEQIAVEDLQD